MAKNSRNELTICLVVLRRIPDDRLIIIGRQRQLAIDHLLVVVPIGWSEPYIDMMSTIVVPCKQKEVQWVSKCLMEQGLWWDELFCLMIIKTVSIREIVLAKTFLPIDLLTLRCTSATSIFESKVFPHIRTPDYLALVKLARSACHGVRIIVGSRTSSLVASSAIVCNCWSRWSVVGVYAPLEWCPLRRYQCVQP